MKKFSWVAYGLLLLGIATGGCGDDGKLKRYPVTGVITYPYGTPIHNLVVLFRSDEHDVRARARTLEDGSYRLSTYEKNDGAVAGKHHILVMPWMKPDGTPGLSIHPKFGQFRTSGLEFQVEPVGKNEFYFKVEKR